jgi:hypothetical protein
MKRQILDVGKVLRNARRIAVIFPVDEEDMSNYRCNIAKLLREQFTGCKICAVVSEGSRVRGFDDVIHLVPGFSTLWKGFFKTKEILRNLRIDISFDLNETVNIITYLVGASLRIGTIDSPFLNVVVKGVEGDPRRMFLIIGSNH